MKQRSLVSISDCNKTDILRILDRAQTFEENPHQRLLEGKVVASLFFEPSTRTRLSFESAIHRLGGRVIGFDSADSSSISKGESLQDTIRTISNYCDLIVMRHPMEGAARFASEIASVPIINAGDGANQHPTQTLLDLYSIRKTQGTLNDLTIFLLGDLKYGRTVHSLMMAMTHFQPTFRFISPERLKMPDEYKMILDDMAISYSEHSDFKPIIYEADILYVTRVQRERFSDPIEYEKVKNAYRVQHSMLKLSKENLKILHPLPRVNEISTDVDRDPRAYYFQQTANGVFTRQAIIASIMGV